MATVVQLTRRLQRRPQVPAIAGVTLRHFAGPQDVETWLDLRRRAFARERVSVGAWDASDFAREFLHKPWWTPSAMWFAEVQPQLLPAEAVGTITLARRGDPPDDKPVVHWLAVVPSYRRRGIGRLLMTTLEAAVWNTGQRQIWLETHSGWIKASQLYESLGYEPTGG